MTVAVGHSGLGKWSVGCLSECPCVVNFWWLQVLVALACDLELDTLPCCAETHKWAWFRRYCMASRVAVALDRRAPLPRVFLDEVLRVTTGHFGEAETRSFHGSAKQPSHCDTATCLWPGITVTNRAHG